MSLEITPELIERFREAAKRGKGIRLDAEGVTALYLMLARAADLRDKPMSLDREAEAAVYILTGGWPRLDKYKATDETTDTPNPEETPR